MFEVDNQKQCKNKREKAMFQNGL